MCRGHGARRTQVIVKEFFQSAHGTVAVFGDDRLLVHMRKEEPFELRVARRSLASIKSVARTSNTFFSASLNFSFSRAEGCVACTCAYASPKIGTSLHSAAMSRSSASRASSRSAVL